MIYASPPQYCHAPASWPLTFWPWKWLSESRVWWATCVPISVFLGFSVLELFPIYATERQRDRRQTVSSLNAPHPTGRWHNNGQTKLSSSAALLWQPSLQAVRMSNRSRIVVATTALLARRKRWHQRRRRRPACRGARAKQNCRLMSRSPTTTVMLNDFTLIHNSRA